MVSKLFDCGGGGSRGGGGDCGGGCDGVIGSGDPHLLFVDRSGGGKGEGGQSFGCEAYMTVVFDRNGDRDGGGGGGVGSVRVLKFLVVSFIWGLFLVVGGPGVGGGGGGWGGGLWWW